MTLTQDQFEAIEAKLCTLHYVPKESLVRAEAFGVLCDLSRDFPHAMQVVDKILESCTQWPANAEIRDAARLVVDEAWEPNVPLVGCPICRNQKFIPVYQLVTVSRGFSGRRHFEAQDITEEVFNDLRTKLPETVMGDERQFVTQAARKCGCQ
jgi:hypothetical protein